MSIFFDYTYGIANSAIDTTIEYLSFHVLLCLVPAFFIAGAMTVFIPTDDVIKYLGPEAKGRVSYPLAAVAGLLLAVCSCTVIPLFVGIYKKGAGLGAAVTFLFAAPAVNILALTYTGSLIGMDIAIARAILAIGFAIIIGISMDLIFPTQEEDRSVKKNERKINTESVKQSSIRTTPISVSVLMAINLISGILLVLLEVEYLLFGLYILGLSSLLLLSKLAKNKELILFIWLVFALFVGTSRIEPFDNSISILSISFPANVSNMLVKAVLAGIVAVLIVFYASMYIQKEDMNEWKNETWIFVKAIFPLILLGVFVAGALKYMIPQEIIIKLVGSNTVLANFIAVFFGVFMYFPTLMEVPMARTFLDLGMS
ncbi:MAG: permease, partial [Candidatus Heimdallarchaeota archaeon]|nr:permease [Candidatus Heimdallarchaeota archaeon]